MRVGVSGCGGSSSPSVRADTAMETRVPNLFAATGSPAWGNPEYPWTTGSTLAPYTLEGYAFADYLTKEKLGTPEHPVRGRFGKDYDEFVVEGTSEDAAMLLAYEAGAKLIVAVGTHDTMVEFLDKGRAGMSSTFLTRLRIGPMLVDAKFADIDTFQSVCDDVAVFLA